MSWSVDGVLFDLPCNIEREAEISSSEISGMMLNKNYFNDVLGTYMRYTISIAIPFGEENTYAELYEILANPQDAHVFNLPYNYEDGGINITARVTNIRDTWVRLAHGNHTWRKTTFDVIANHPSKDVDGSRHGMTAMPEDVEAPVGSLYEKTSYGWIQRIYEDADEKEY